MRAHRNPYGRQEGNLREMGGRLKRKKTDIAYAIFSRGQRCKPSNLCALVRLCGHLVLGSVVNPHVRLVVGPRTSFRSS